MAPWTLSVHRVKTTACCNTLDHQSVPLFSLRMRRCSSLAVIADRFASTTCSDNPPYWCTTLSLRTNLGFCKVYVWLIADALQPSVATKRYMYGMSDNYRNLCIPFDTTQRFGQCITSRIPKEWWLGIMTVGYLSILSIHKRHFCNDKNSSF